MRTRTVRPADTRAIAPKVTAAGVVGALLGGAASLAAAVQASGFFGALPTWLQTVVGLLAGGVLTTLAGYLAPHQPRRSTAD